MGNLTQRQKTEKEAAKMQGNSKRVKEFTAFLEQATSLSEATANENKLAYVCSPYRGNIINRIRNIIYAKQLTRAAADLGFTPITTHLYLTQVFDDNDPKERKQGMSAGKEILKHCGTIVIGVRYGISSGMASEIAAAADKNTIIIV